MERNPTFSSLQPRYLFSEISHIVSSHPDAINLSIGDTSEPIPSVITDAIQEKARQLSTTSGYQGYGSAQGDLSLREKIADFFYENRISPDDIFISDGAKCDVGRLQVLFGGVTTAIQNPTYPAYADTGLLLNQKIVYLDCLPKNNFFPKAMPKADIAYICSPNNPTGAVASYEQLKELVDIAIKQKTFIIFDSAYSCFIKDKSLPRSIYEIPESKKIAIEISSFSKLIGFTGIRLGWSVVPKELLYNDGSSVKNDFLRIATTFFNGASRLSQSGGMAALSYPNEIEKLCSHYMENARLLKDSITSKGLDIYGANNVPYLWVDFRKKSCDSWKVFRTLLEKTKIVTTPGVGFGSCGEGFLRFSAFANRSKIIKAKEQIESRWPEAF